MNFKELQETVITDIDEDINDIDLVKKIKSFINRGYMELAKLEGLEKSFKATPKEKIIKLPADFARLYNVSYEGSSMPYSISGKELYVNSSQKLTVTYNYRPEELVFSEDEPETNSMNEEFIVAYAKWKYYSSEQEINAAAIAKTEVDQYRIMRLDRANHMTPKYVIE